MNALHRRDLIPYFYLLRAWWFLSSLSSAVGQVGGGAFQGDVDAEMLATLAVVGDDYNGAAVGDVGGGAFEGDLNAEVLETEDVDEA